MTSADISPEAIQKLGILGVVIFVASITIRWLLAERKALLEALAAVEQRERDLRDRRATELLEQASLYAKSNELIRNALADVTRANDNLTDAFEKLERRIEDAKRNS